VTWRFLRAVCHRGYVLTSGLYFVVVAHLSAAEVLLLGTVMALTMLVSDVPTGVWSDTVSRKWTLVAGHGFLVVGMVVTGVVTAYPWIAATQVSWGLGWALLSGADVAWLTDELDRPRLIARVLTAGARWELAGGAAGMVAFGALGWAAGLATAIVVSGSGMALAGMYVAVAFTEHDFAPARTRGERHTTPAQERLSAASSAFRRGLALAHGDREILIVLAATVIVTGAGAIAWSFPRRLADLGFPGDPVLWYTAIGVLSSAAGSAGLRVVQARIDGADTARRVYALACLLGMLGLVTLAGASGALVGGLGVLLVSGISDNLTRTVSVIWINRRATNDVRATVHSFLSQAETGGKIAGGLALAALAGAMGTGAALVASGALIACAAVLVTRARPYPPTSRSEHP
jgi:MFS family permease